jgi:hypothetical protein
LPDLSSRRFDVGQRTRFELTTMAIAAVEQIVEWQVPRVAATLAARTAGIARRLSELGLDPLPDGRRGPHLLGVRLPEAVRARVLPALAEVDCFAAVRGASLRICTRRTRMSSGSSPRCRRRQDALRERCRAGARAAGPVSGQGPPAHPAGGGAGGPA